MARFAFAFVDVPLNLCLCRNRGVVSSRKPERPESAHPFVANHDVLKREHERVSHVENAGGIGRRHDHGEAFSVWRVAFSGEAVRTEETALFPELVDATLRFLRVVGFEKFSVNHASCVSS